MTENKKSIGRVHSIQSMGTLDGPGVRFVVFLQGCNLRCKCCHNPDTWEYGTGKKYTPQEIVSRAERFREYFGSEGGITLSGGEPLLQADFARRVFELCHEIGINTCIDTSGSIINSDVLRLLDVTDRVLLDVKYTEDKLYRENVGCGIDKPLEFLKLLDDRAIPTTLRQVTIPTVNDSAESILKLREITAAHSCVDKVELLPFRKICQVKYDNMEMEFPFGHLPEPTEAKMTELRNLLK